MLVDVLTEHFAVDSEEALTAFTEAASIGEVESGEQLFDDSDHQIAIVLLRSRKHRRSVICVPSPEASTP